MNEQPSAEEEGNKRERSENLREQLGFDPDKLLKTVRKFTDLYNKYVLLQFPLTDALKERLKELFEKQYPGIKPYRHGWHVNWVFEAMETCANTISIDFQMY